ncbi:protein MALE DISCOVERER 2-like isoform X3 [Carex rostrata]
MHLKDLGLRGTTDSELETFLTNLLFTGSWLSQGFNTPPKEFESTKATVMSNSDHSFRNSADGIIRRRVLQINEDPLSVSQAKRTHPKIKPLQTPIPSPSPSPSPSQGTTNNLSPELKTHSSINSPTKSPISKLGTSKTQGRKHSPSLLLYVLVGVAICGVLAAISGGVYLIFVRYRKFGVINPWATGLSGHLKNAFVTGVPLLNRSELEAACEDFSNILGTLPGCVLYKGTLSSGSEITVVSTMVTSATEWSDQLQAHFRNKVSVLSEFSHKNFMNLVGYCEDEEPFTRMMVFEYTPNGTLFEHLHIKEAEQLDWTSRLRIAAGVIYCLDYMHCFNPPVTLKTLNSLSIYLTEDYAAKVADAKLHLEEKDCDSDSDFDCSDEESAVYKFGVLLLEIISGRLPFSKDDGLLVLWASSYLNGKRPIMTMVDPTLKEVPETHVMALVEVIKSCIKPEMRERPGIAEVAARMRNITGISPEAAAPRKSPLWWAEIEVNSFEI